MTKCPKCAYKCAETKVAIICPNCDYIHIKKDEWQGKTTKCPKCSKVAKVFKNQGIGYTFECFNCDISGRYIDDSEVHAKVVPKNTELGKKLEWLFNVPTKIFHHDDSILADCDECGKKHCAHCDTKKICEIHKDEVIEFCDKHNIEVFIANEYIEIVPKN